MKYIKNTTKDTESTIYCSNGKHSSYLVLFWSLGHIEKSFSPKLPEYFIQGVRNPGPDLVYAQKVVGLKRQSNSPHLVMFVCLHQSGPLNKGPYGCHTRLQFTILKENKLIKQSFTQQKQKLLKAIMCVLLLSIRNSKWPPSPHRQ